MNGAGILTKPDVTSVYIDTTGAPAITSFENVCIGNGAGSNMVTSCFDNVLIGYESGISLDSANNNVLVGTNSTFGYTLGSGAVQNVLIGNRLDTSIANASNRIGIGYNFTVSDNNSCQIGNSSVTKLKLGNVPVLYSNVVSNQHFGSNPVNITSATECTAIGSTALDSITTGANNTAVGSGAGTGLTTGGNNTVLGSIAYSGQTDGNDNVCIGFNSVGSSSASCNRIVAIGRNSFAASAGDDNVIIGYLSGSVLGVSIDKCTFIGASSSGVSSNDNQIAIGYQATSIAANSAIIGNSSITQFTPHASATNNLGTRTNPWNQLNLKSYIELADQTAPANPSAGQGRLYKKTGNDGIFWLPDAAGAEVDLTSSGSSSLIYSDESIETSTSNTGSMTIANLTTRAMTYTTVGTTLSNTGTSTNPIFTYTGLGGRVKATFKANVYKPLCTANYLWRINNTGTNYTRSYPPINVGSDEEFSQVLTLATNDNITLDHNIYNPVTFSVIVDSSAINFVSYDNCNTWVNSNPINAPISNRFQITMHKNNAYRLITDGSTVTYRSLNNQYTGTPIASSGLTSSPANNGIYMETPNVFVYITNFHSGFIGGYRSADNGVTWTTFNTGSNTPVKIIGITGGSGGCATTNDAGNPIKRTINAFTATVSPTSNALGAVLINDNMCYHLANNSVYICKAVSAVGDNMAVSNDGGDNFTALGGTGYNITAGSIFYSMASSGTILVQSYRTLTVGNVIFSLDDGATWTVSSNASSLIPASDQLQKIIWANNKFVGLLTNVSGTGACVLTSLDGDTWIKSGPDALYPTTSSTCITTNETTSTTTTNMTNQSILIEEL